MQAHTSVSVSVPAIRYGSTVTTGLIPGAAPSITLPPSQPPSSSSPSAPALFSSTCTLGFVNADGAFVANTAANWNTSGNSTAEQVTLTNVGTVGATLASLETETTWHGQVIITHTLDGLPTLPEFLTPGETYSAVAEFRDLGGGVSVTETTYLQSQCSVVTWYQP